MPGPPGSQAPGPSRQRDEPGKRKSFTRQHRTHQADPVPLAVITRSDVVPSEQATTTSRSQRSATPLITQGAGQRLHISACPAWRRQASPRRYPVPAGTTDPITDPGRALVKRQK